MKNFQMGTKINKDQEKCGRYIKVSEKKKGKSKKNAAKNIHRG